MLVGTLSNDEEKDRVFFFYFQCVADGYFL